MPIRHVPERIRKAGIADAHPRPLVGKRTAAGEFVSARKYASPEVWQDWPHVETRTGTSNTAIGVDVDHPDSLYQIRELVDAHKIPAPSWSVTRSENGHSHFVWTLETPVHRYAGARHKPRLMLRDAETYLTVATEADQGYNGVLSKNPHFCADDPRYYVEWLHQGGYTLGEILDYRPAGWKQPPKTETGIGRNVSMHDALCKWAGRLLANQPQAALAPMAAVINAENKHPMAASEVATIIRSVEGHRQGWLTDGHKPEWLARQAALASLGGKASAEARRASTSERDSEILAAHRRGDSFRHIGTLYGLSHEAARQICKRELALLAH